MPSFTRSQCWAGKDAYFQCLDGLKSTTKNLPEDPGAPQCAELKHTFRASCLESWVKHFEIQRFGEVAMKEHGLQLNEPEAPSQMIVDTAKGKTDQQRTV